ncbi:type II secretion system F family protein [Microbispora sp. H10949]|uniref:type II secretion system F family protein n=1 Tax=Microbispora sp. H10949 TaxID=2729111 RepID=UPI0016047F42|nr:type II secretion system F family protein [Microbispora sp. H10949]
MNLFLAAGALAGFGLFLLVRELRPAPPRLEEAVARLRAGYVPPDTSGDLTQRIGRLMATHLGSLPSPHRDLALLGRPVERFLAAKLGLAVPGLLLPAALSALLATRGGDPGIALPAGASLLAGVVLFFTPDLAVRSEAARRRADFRHAVTGYLDLVALERSAGAGPADALEKAASVSDGWAFARIAAVLQQARRHQRPAWEGLARLGEQVGVTELTDLADIAALAGQEGARVLDTLISKAASMRGQALAAAKAEANGRTTAMVIPVALLGAAFLLMLTFPQIYRLAIAG